MKPFLLLLVFAAPTFAANEADFGLISVSPLESARLTGYCDGSVEPTPCTVMFEFHDAAGRTLQQSTVTLAPGTGGFLDLAPAAAGVGRPSEINPCFKVLRGAAFASLEVFDVFSERTHIMISWADGSVRKSGDIDFGMGAISRGDTARLGAFCEGDGSVLPTPCDVVFEFHDINGRLLKQTTMILQPGTGGVLDLRWQDTGSTARRVEITPCFKVLRGSAITNFAIIDSALGVTLSQSYQATRLVAVD